MIFLTPNPETRYVTTNNNILIFTIGVSKKKKVLNFENLMCSLLCECTDIKEWLLHMYIAYLLWVNLDFLLKNMNSNITSDFYSVVHLPVDNTEILSKGTDPTDTCQHFILDISFLYFCKYALCSV